MKYIKAYEKLTEYKYKRYIVWQTASTLKYEILEVFDEIDWVFDDPKYKNKKEKEHHQNGTRSIKSRRIYDYYVDKQEFIKVDNIEFFRPSLSENFIVFQSDKLKDCISFIKINDTSKKYNL